MNGDPLSAEQIDAIARLPSREVLYGRLVGMVASPLTGLAAALGGLIGGLARQLQQMADRASWAATRPRPSRPAPRPRLSRAGPRRTSPPAEAAAAAEPEPQLPRSRAGPGPDPQPTETQED